MVRGHSISRKTHLDQSAAYHNCQATDQSLKQRVFINKTNPLTRDLDGSYQLDTQSGLINLTDQRGYFQILLL